ncbi:MAG: hypothetical protein KGR68_17690 [Betaproteobacteria bacterium]|nr:hypothetical protein [Betaproteobacteria bacterium]
MNFKRRHDWRKHRFDETQLVHGIVDDSASHRSSGGELEEMRDRIDALTQVLNYVVSLMPPDQVRQLAIHFGYEEDRT